MSQQQIQAQGGPSGGPSARRIIFPVLWIVGLAALLLATLGLYQRANAAPVAATWQQPVGTVDDAAVVEAAQAWGAPFTGACWHVRSWRRRVWTRAVRQVILEESVDPLVAQSALKHGLGGEEILHAYRNPIRVWDLGDGFTMIVGANRAATMIEIGVVQGVSGVVIIHAMRAREKFVR